MLITEVFSYYVRKTNEVEFPLLCHLVIGKFNIRWQHIIFVLTSLYTLFSCDLADVLGRNAPKYLPNRCIYR